MWILIRWLHQKPADLNLHVQCFNKISWFSNTRFNSIDINSVEPDELPLSTVSGLPALLVITEASLEHNWAIKISSFDQQLLITNKAKGIQYTGLTLAQQHLNLAKWKKQNEIDFSQGFSQRVVPISCSVFNSAH